MKLQVHSKGIHVTKELHRFIEKRLRYALNRFGERARKVRVSLTDINGPRGGEDIRCRVLAHVGGRTLAIDETQSEPFAAVSHAAERIGRTVARRIDRRKSGPRRR